MNTGLYKYCVMLLYTILTASLHAQCNYDLFGRWEDIKQEISLETEEYRGGMNGVIGCVIKNNTSNFKVSGIFNWEDFWEGERIVKIGYSHRDTLTNKYSTRYLKFRVLRNTTQQLIIRPSSKHTVDLFGNSAIELYNKDFITWDDIHLDRLYFSREGELYAVNLITGEAYRKTAPQPYYPNRKYHLKIYTSTLDKDFLASLYENVMRSKIINMSVCERHRSCPCDLIPSHLAIDYNERVIDYVICMIPDSVYPLVQDMNKVVLELKWRKAPDSEILDDEFKYFGSIA